MTDSKEWCDGDWRCRSSSKPFAGAESGSPGRALEAGKRGSPGRPVQAGIRGKRLTKISVNDFHYNMCVQVYALVRFAMKVLCTTTGEREMAHSLQLPVACTHTHTAPWVSH